MSKQYECVFIRNNVHLYVFLRKLIKYAPLSPPPPPWFPPKPSSILNQAGPAWDPAGLGPGLEVEAAYKASWDEAAEQLPQLIDRLMCAVSATCVVACARQRVCLLCNVCVCIAAA